MASIEGERRESQEYKPSSSLTLETSIVDCSILIVDCSILTVHLHKATAIDVLWFDARTKLVDTILWKPPSGNA